MIFKYFILFLKGMAMGIANIIPGVSGGTIALITEIYEELLNSLKSIDLHALKLLKSKKIKEFIDYTNFYFLLSVFGGSIISVISVAKIFEYLFQKQESFIWSFFFGLILSSIYFIGKRITKLNFLNSSVLILGAIIAIFLSYISPTSPNENLFFVFLCGIVGISGMMLPGLSGSYILILMGNYELLMVTAIAELNVLLLAIFFIGSVFGLLTFSKILSWIFKNYRDLTLSLLTGFVLGSLRLVWPWKTITKQVDDIIISYTLEIPNLNKETILCFALINFGIYLVYKIEQPYSKKTK